MRVAVVGEPAGWHVGRLTAALAAAGHEPTVVPWAAIGAAVTAGTDGFSPPVLAGCDVVAVRGMPGAGGPADRLEEIVLRMDVLGRLAARGTRVVNAPRALEVAIDKYLSLSLLAAAGLPVPETRVVQGTAAAVAAAAALGERCVLKPLFGSRGRGLQLLATAEEVAAAVAARGPVAYLQEFVAHEGWDVRILVVGDAWFAMRRVAPAGEWRTNVSLGGRPEPFSPPADWVRLAFRAAAAVSAEVAGVDILPARDGRVLVLEVNAVPGWRGLEAATCADVAGAVARHLTAGM
jgi:ribosomal protein S6--L-glutamate ligase